MKSFRKLSKTTTLNPQNTKGRIPGHRNLTKVKKGYARFEGNWNQIWASKEFKELNIPTMKFQNHIRSKKKRARDQNLPQLGQEERSSILEDLERIADQSSEEELPTKRQKVEYEEEAESTGIDFMSCNFSQS